MITRIGDYLQHHTVWADWILVPPAIALVIFIIGIFKQVRK